MKMRFYSHANLIHFYMNGCAAGIFLWQATQVVCGRQPGNWLVCVLSDYKYWYYPYRVHTGHGKPGKLWNLWFQFSRPGKSWNLIEGHGMLWKSNVLSKIKRQKEKKFEKIINKFKPGFSFSRNESKHIFYALYCWKMLLNDCFDVTVRTNALILVMEYLERSCKRSWKAVEY